MRTLRLAITATAILAMLTASAQAAKKQTRIGRQITDFTLRDHLGASHQLSDYEDSKLVVVAFLGTDCPLVKLYGPKLQEISEKYQGQGVTVLGINSNCQDSPRKMGAAARQLGMTFTILKDPDNQVADMFGAKRTPEVFLLDEDRVIRYCGRIDDQYGFESGVGYGRPSVTRHDLMIAMDELLAGQQISVPTTKAPGCIIGRVPDVEPHGDVTYSNQIARILQNRCVECHREGQIGPFPLTTYEEVLGWGEMIRETVESGRMPPWYANPDHGTFRNDPTLTDEEKQLLYTWVENGQPEGDPADLPEPLQFVEGWQIPEPDMVLKMSETPYEVAADGVIDYQYFTVDPGFKEDKWVKAAEARPGNRAVVHHIICFIEKPGQGGGGFRGGGALIGYAPGMQARHYRDGVAVKVPAGSKFVFQMHYTPVGTKQLDNSSLGIVFADPEEVTHEIRGGVSGKLTFRIPPQAEDHVIRTSHKLRRDTMLVSMMPHMHLRGTSFRYEAEYPDGSREILLDVPEYDFNWQLWYDLEQPKLLPKGTRIRCEAHYNNSESNVYNPDPNAWVTFGDQTWEEMMFGFYTTIVPAETDKSSSDDRVKTASR